MAHFCRLNEDNVVVQIINVSDNDIKDLNGVESEEIGIAFCKKLVGFDTNWKQTSYDSNFRTRHAEIGYSYDETLDAFIPPKPYESWVLNQSTKDWESPVPKPELTEEQISSGLFYDWDEVNQEWVLV